MSVLDTERPTLRWRRAACMDLQPWRVDIDGWYWRRLQPLEFVAIFDDTQGFLDRGRVYCRSEAQAMEIDRCGALTGSVW